MKNHVKPPSPIKIVWYLKSKTNGHAFTPEEIKNSLDRKEDYIRCYFPKNGGGNVTDHERAYTQGKLALNLLIKQGNTYKCMMFLLNKNNVEGRCCLWVERILWQFDYIPDFETYASGHRYIRAQQSVDIWKDAIFLKKGNGIVSSKEYTPPVKQKLVAAASTNDLTQIGTIINKSEVKKILTTEINRTTDKPVLTKAELDIIFANSKAMEQKYSHLIK